MQFVNVCECTTLEYDAYIIESVSLLEGCLLASIGGARGYLRGCKCVTKSRIVILSQKVE